ncbi:MAG: LacI family DNA-binding transcriptional regulator [Burkholderia gladioli]
MSGKLPPSPPSAPVTRPSSTAVARLAGVSQSTVSRVFTPGAAVSDAVRDKVLKAAAELHYQPNALPAILQTGRSGLIAVIVGGFYNPFYTDFLGRMVTVLREQRYETLVVHTSSDDHVGDIVGELSRYRIDGVISALAIHSRRVAQQLASFRIPIVGVNSRKLGALRGITSGNRAAGATAADTLVEAGCERIAHLAGRESSPQAERQRGFVEQARRLKLPEPAIEVAGYSYDEGYEAAVRLLSREGPRPDGIFCINDLVAIGAMDAIRREFGLRVPEDIQLIGFDDIPMAAWKNADLSTFRQDVDALAAGAAALLHGEEPSLTVIVPTRRVLRGTTRLPRSDA